MLSKPKKRWTATEIEKLKSMAGNHQVRQIAQELARPTYSIRNKASQLKMSIAFHLRARSRLPCDMN